MGKASLHVKNIAVLVDLHRKIREVERYQSTNQGAQGADFSHQNSLMEIFMEGESEASPGYGGG